MLYSSVHEKLLINFLEETSINKLYVSDSMFACRNFNDLHDYQLSHKIYGTLPQVHQNVRVTNSFADTTLISHDTHRKDIKQSDYIIPYLMADQQKVSPKVLHSLCKRIQVGFFADDPNLNLLVSTVKDIIKKRDLHIEVTPKDQESVLKRNFNFKPYTNLSNPHNVFHRNISRVLLLQVNNLLLRSLDANTNLNHTMNLIDFYKETMPPERFNRLGKDLLDMLHEDNKLRLKGAKLAITSMWATDDFKPIVLPNSFNNENLLNQNEAYSIVKNASRMNAYVGMHIENSLKDLELNVFKYINYNGKKTVNPFEIREVFENNLIEFGRDAILRSLENTMRSVKPKIVDNDHFSRDSFHKNLAETIKIAYELTDSKEKPTTLMSDFVNDLKRNIIEFIDEQKNNDTKIPWERLDTKVKFSVAHDIINSFIKHNKDHAKTIEPDSGWAIVLQECKDLIRGNFNSPKQSVLQDIDKEIIEFQKYVIDRSSEEEDSLGMVNGR